MFWLQRVIEFIDNFGSSCVNACSWRFKTKSL